MSSDARESERPLSSDADKRVDKLAYNYLSQFKWQVKNHPHPSIISLKEKKSRFGPRASLMLILGEGGGGGGGFISNFTPTEIVVTNY